MINPNPNNKIELTDTVICDKCRNQIVWHYILPQKISNGRLVAISYPIETVFASRRIESMDDEYTYSVRCPKCDNIIKFNYDDV